MSWLRYISIFAILVLGVRLALGSTGAPSSSAGLSGTRVFVHGQAPLTIPDGEHTFHIRVYRKDGGLVYEESVQGDVESSGYDLILGSRAPLTVSLKDDMSIRVSIDGGTELPIQDRMGTLSQSAESGISRSLREKEQNGFAAIVRQQVALQAAERIAKFTAGRGARLRYIAGLLMPYEPATGLEFEAGVAPPAENMPHDPYQLAKYGRLNVEYQNLAVIDGGHVGVAAQALHVAHHVLMYSAGLTTDINNDGMFTLTTGITHYQTGQKRDEPFVDAPFMRFKFRSSNDNIFAYSELETTMHDRAYISGMVGLGMMVAPGVRFVAGLAHTEFVMPTERMVQQVNGLQGTFMWGVR